MKKACLGIGIFVVVMAAASLGAFAQQADLKQMSRDLAAKSDADRAHAYSLAAKNGWPIRGTGQDGSYFELQKILNGFPRYYSTFNTNAAISTRADSVNMAIGGGSGFVLRLWDGGKPLTTHRELTGRVTWADARDRDPGGGQRDVLRGDHPCLRVEQRRKRDGRRSRRGREPLEPFVRIYRWLV
jgi:hypothetical protein